MPDTGLTAPGMTKLPRRYDVTITVDRDVGDHPDPAEFAVAAKQAASARAASIVSAHRASQIISTVTVPVTDQRAAVAVALAVASDALNGGIPPSSVRWRLLASHPLAGKHPLIRSCRSPFAIQLELFPQLRDDAASRVDVLDRQVLGKAVRPRRLQTAGLVIGPAPLIGQHDE